MESHGRIICSVFYGKSDNVQEVLMYILSIYPRDPPRGGVIEFMVTLILVKLIVIVPLFVNSFNL